MGDLNAPAVKRWAFLRLAHVSLDYHVLTAQSFGKSNTRNRKYLVEQSNGNAQIVLDQLRYVVEYQDGVLHSKPVIRSKVSSE